MEPKFKTGDLVWARMKSYPPWPSMVIDPPRVRPHHQWVYFFGSKNSGWVEDHAVAPYESHKEDMKKSVKTKAFEDACEEIEEHIRTGTKIVFNLDSEDPFDKLLKSKPKAKAAGKKQAQRASLNDTVASNKSECDDDESSEQTPSKDNEGKRVTRRKTSSVGRVKKNKLSATVPDTPTSTDSQNAIGSLHTPSIPKPEVTAIFSSATRSDSPQPLSVDHAAELNRKKNIIPSELKFGFLGLGTIGTAFVKNLLNTGHKVVIWNRSPQKYTPLEEIGAEVAQTPSDVISAADITFCCVADVHAAKELVFGNCGVLSEMRPPKAYVEMSAIDAETSQQIGEAITTNGGKYLEVRFEGTKPFFESGMINIMVSGDSSVFQDCTSCFDACGSNVMYLGDVGNAPKMYLVYQSILGVSIEGLAELMTLSERLELNRPLLMRLLRISSLDCSHVINNGKTMTNSEISTNLPLRYLYKDIKLAHSLAENLSQPMPALSITQEAFVNAKRLGYGDQDASSVIVHSKH